MFFNPYLSKIQACEIYRKCKIYIINCVIIYELKLFGSTWNRRPCSFPDGERGPAPEREAPPRTDVPPSFLPLAPSSLNPFPPVVSSTRPGQTLRQEERLGEEDSRSHIMCLLSDGPFQVQVYEKMSFFNMLINRP